MANLARFGKPTSRSDDAKTGGWPAGAWAARSDQGRTQRQPAVSRVRPVSPHRAGSLRRTGHRCHPAVRLSKVHRDARRSCEGRDGRRDFTMKDDRLMLLCHNVVGRHGPVIRAHQQTAPSRRLWWPGFALW